MSQQSKMDSPIRRSMTASRPSYNDLAAASQQVGARILKAAHNLAGAAKKGPVGVSVYIDQADGRMEVPLALSWQSWNRLKCR